MKKSTKIIALLTVVAMMAGTIVPAVADHKVYTSPTFKIPKDRIKLDEDPAGTDNHGTDPDEGDEIMVPEPDGTEDPDGDGTPTDGGEGTGTPDETEPEMQVIIHSSRKPEVTKGDIIEMTSELIGFDGIEVAYQWQVDRNDGEGWVDATGIYANREMYRFVADEETVLYSWRLIVRPIE